MQNTSTFQYAVIGIFVVFIILGIVIFAGFTGGSGSGTATSVQVSVWGTFPKEKINEVVEKVNTKVVGTVNILYSEHSLDKIDSDLTTAIAQGSGPDMVILPADHIQKETKLFAAIPFSVIPQRTYQDTFASPANIFVNNQSIIALPFLIDPLVLYWNKDIFATAGIPTPPTSWNDLVALVPKLSSVTTSKTILQSALPIGEYQNVKNAKEILSVLFLQAGNPITMYKGGVLVSALDSVNAQNNPVESALNFYTQFANPSSVAYTWNRSLPNSNEMFLRGKSATYIGFASEYNTLSAGNPNLNFDVSILPQAQGASASLTYAQVYGIAIVNSSKNQQSALANAEAMVSSDFMDELSQEVNLPSVRISQLSAQAPSTAGEIFRRSVLIGRDWIDPDTDATEGYFQAMIESVNNGSSSLSDAVNSFNKQLNESLK